ncbi:MAG: DUF2974 domain-containing protein [Treponema sp.]|nr:DUF2974 domain-containing protein [Treponema sp.]MCL2272924.1 DUF2974 domain-containing protein [Treponema sp.]
MANLFDYLRWRGDLDFNASPFNPVDFLIFSQLSYLPFDGIVPCPGVSEGISIHTALNEVKDILKFRKYDTGQFLGFKEEPQLIDALCLSNRFRNCYLLGYINQIDLKNEYQVSAVCIHTDDGFYSVVFRGTDATLVGWKEDFNMCFRDVIPAQMEAVRYLDSMAPYLKGSLRVGGHSKGGNLAIYSASFCSGKIKNRITDIYNFDGPGFNDNVIENENIKINGEKIKTFIPQESVIGMLFKYAGALKVVKSSETGLLQHSLFSWEVTHNDFIHVDNVTPGSRFVDKTLRHWIDNLDSGDREKVIEALYTILSTADIKSIHDIENNFFPSMGKIIKSLGNIDEHTRKLMKKTFIEFLRSARRNFNTLLEQH